VTNVLLAAPVVFLVLWLPGLLLTTALRPAAGVVRNLALAPAASYGLLMAIGLAMDAVGAPVRWWSVLAPALVVAAGALVLVRRKGHGDVGRTALDLRPLEFLVLAVVIVGALAVWLHASRWGGAVPPNDDGTHHGLFTARILRLGTLDPSRVAVGDVLTGRPAVGYYPFGMHLVAALVASLSGLGVGTAVDAVPIAGAAVMLPLGVFVLTRRIFPTMGWTAVVASVFALAFPAFPYYVAYWGGLTMIAGVALVPALVDAAIGVADDGRSVPVGIAFGLAFLGLFELHNTEVVTVVAMVAPLMLLPWGATALTRLRRSLPAWLIGAACFCVVALPQAPTLAANATSRVVAAPLPAVSTADAWSDAATTFIGFGSVSRAVLAVLVVVGLVAAIRVRAVGWVAGGLVFLLLTFAAARRYGWADTLTSAWYTRWDRVVIDELFYLAALAGVGFVVVAQAARATVSRVAVGRVRLVRPLSMALCALSAILVVAASLVPQWRGDRANLHLAFSGASNVDDGQRAAFGFLAQHVESGQRVLNDVTQDSAWMYADDGVAPVFAMAVRAFPAKDWGLRIYLLRNATHLASKPAVARVADEWHVEWAFVSTQLFPLRKTMLTVRGLSASPAWQLVFHSGSAYVFKRVRTSGSA
jgi:hypothetical protein